MIRIGLLTEVISPYRIPVFNCLAAVTGFDLEVIFLAETEARHAWTIPIHDIHFFNRVLPARVVGRIYQGAPIYINRGIIQQLARGKYDVIITGGYHHPTYWLALLYAKITRTTVILWSESTCQDERSENSLKEAVKRFLISRYSGYIVPGTPQKAYLQDFEVPSDRIFVAPNAVDVARFAEVSQRYRENKKALKREMGILGPIVLFVGRLIEAKGVRDLIEACETVRKEMDVTLLVVGSGPDQAAFEAEAAASRSGVRFAGFQQQDILPKFYAMADIFVMPTYSDPWGLVINEAMACGLPIISSTAAGAAMDLVRAGENGYLFEPGEKEVLAQHIKRLLCAPVQVEAMGRASREIIRQYSPDRCAEGFVQAILSATSSRQTKDMRSSK